MIAEWQASLPSTWAFGAYWAVVVLVVVVLHQLVERWEENNVVDEKKDNGPLVEGQVGHLRYVVQRGQARATEVTTWTVFDGPVCLATGIVPVRNLGEEELEARHAARVAKSTARALLFAVIVGPSGRVV